MELKAVAETSIEKRILVMRGRQVLLDEDLAGLYGVETRVLVQQVKRNLKRFPADFMLLSGVLRSDRAIAVNIENHAGIRRASSRRQFLCGTPRAASGS